MRSTLIVPSNTPHQVIPTGGAPIVLMTLHCRIRRWTGRRRTKKLRTVEFHHLSEQNFMVCAFQAGMPRP